MKFRLLTAHDCLSEHLYGIGWAQSPLCPLCSLQSAINVAHLPTCPVVEASNDFVEKYWTTRGKMTKLLTPLYN